jgi:hypothetical protein
MRFAEMKTKRFPDDCPVPPVMRDISAHCVSERPVVSEGLSTVATVNCEDFFK